MSSRGPVNHIDRATRVHYIVENCTICGGTHRHGAVNDLRPGETTHRTAHCAGELVEYQLLMTDSTEVEQ